MAGKITTIKQYLLTQIEITKFEQALADAEEHGGKLHPILARAMGEALRSQLEDLREQVQEFENSLSATTPP